MCHASTGFTHQVAMRRQKNHFLVTTGIYALSRHPGYLGWLIWSIGTQVVYKIDKICLKLALQVILCNPVCIVVYAYVGYDFLRHRICEEEQYLIEFFGQRYVAYQHRVNTGIPGIKGFSRKLPLATDDKICMNGM